MENKFNTILARLEALIKCDPYADYHGDVSFEESKNGDWVSFYEIEELIVEIKDGNIRPPKPIVEEKPASTSKLSVSDKFQLQIKQMEKEIAMINSIIESSKTS